MPFFLRRNLLEWKKRAPRLEIERLAKGDYTGRKSKQIAESENAAASKQNK
jgi:hypothetical protein